MILETSVFENIVKFISNSAKLIGFNWIAIIAFALLLLTIVVSYVCTIFSIDVKTSKAVQRINLYLEKNPYVNDENLVEFNKLMKLIPAPMRAQWQQYMVGRDKKPSEYFTEENCIDKPFKSSNYVSHVLAVKVLTCAIAIIGFVFSAGAVIDSVGVGQGLLQASLISGFVGILGAMYILFLKSRRNALLYDLYYNFTNLKNYLDRAVTTLPDYVDYEIMFTKKEISAGIPVLQEYLKQRAEYEQAQIEKAKASQVEHEQYDFSSLGVDSAIIMEKAMRECEYMLGNKKRIMSEISELQSNLESYERTYEEKNRGTQRKLRDIQENLDRLKEKLQATTNMIVGNDLRKQRENEIEKQRQIEKESAEDAAKFEATKQQVLGQIESKRQEIEGFRKNAEAVLTDEFKAYSDKIHAELKKIADEQVKDELDSAHSQIDNLQVELENKEKVLVEKNALLSDQMEIEAFANEVQASYEDLSQEYEKNQKELEAKDKQVEDLLAQIESLSKLAQDKEQKRVEKLNKQKEEIENKEAEQLEEQVFEEPVEELEQDLPQQDLQEEIKEQPEENLEENQEQVNEEPEIVEEEPKKEEPQEKDDSEKLEDVEQIFEAIVEEKQKKVAKKAPAKAQTKKDKNKRPWTKKDGKKN